MVVAQCWVLDFGDFPTDLLQYLASPSLAGGNVFLLGDGFRTAGFVDVEDSEVGGLLRAEAEEHGLRFFCIACHGGEFKLLLVKTLLSRTV